MPSGQPTFSATMKRGVHGAPIGWKVDVIDTYDGIKIEMECYSDDVGNGNPVAIYMSRRDALRLVQSIGAALERNEVERTEVKDRRAARESSISK